MTLSLMHFFLYVGLYFYLQDEATTHLKKPLRWILVVSLDSVNSSLMINRVCARCSNGFLCCYSDAKYSGSSVNFIIGTTAGLTNGQLRLPSVLSLLVLSKEICFCLFQVCYSIPLPQSNITRGTVPTPRPRSAKQRAPCCTRGVCDPSFEDPL